MRKWTSVLVAVVSLLAAGAGVSLAQDAGGIDIGFHGAGPYTLYSLKDDNAKLEPALLLTLLNYHWINGHAGVKGTEWAASQFAEFEGVLAASADLKKLALELAKKDPVELNSLLSALQFGAYISKEFNTTETLTEGGIDYGLLGGFKLEF